MRGKNKCKILKEIRQKIADENDIPYVTQECTYQGECKGTCPKCEAELRYLEQQLAKRQRLGKTVTVAALAASLMANLTACPSAEKQSAQVSPESTFFAQTTESNDDEFPDAPTHELTENTTEEETKGIIEIEGDVAYFDPEEIESDLVVGMLPISEAEDDE